MKKKILSIALVLAGLIGSTAVAQTSASTDSSKAQTEQTVSKKDKKDKKDRKDRKNKGQRFNPFEGLNLSEKQQAELKTLDDGIRAEKAKIEAKEKADKKDMLEKRKNDEKEYLAKIKEILTPEQYVQFLENSFLSNRNARPFGKNPGKMGMRPGKDGKQGPRSDRNKGGDRGGKRNAPAEQSAAK